MRAFTNLLLLTLTISFVTTTISAQQLQCIICPEQLGVTNVESGASIQSLAPIKASAVKKTETTKITVQSPQFMADVADEKEILGFASNNLIPISEDEDLCGDPLECGLVTEEELVLAEKTFQLYPNPAHHWVVINKDDLGEGDFQVTIKDANGRAVKTQMMAAQKITLNLKSFTKGTYFITLRSEATYTEWVQKVNIQ
ncbi:MAG: T9SS type A sorting domain-containing protein [Saprospiraceae bacterium]